MYLNRCFHNVQKLMSEHRSVTEEPPWKDSRKTTESLKQALPVQNLTLNFDAAQNYKIYVLEAST